VIAVSEPSPEPTGSSGLPQQIDAARQGSRDALGDLLENYRNYLLLVANHELDSTLQAKGGASDLVQETFLKAQRAFAQFEGKSEAELLAWLRTILMNNLANLNRDFHTDKRQLLRERSLDEHSGTPSTRVELRAGIETPSELVIAQEDSQLLQQALRRLPDDYRQVIELRHQDGLSFADVGRRMNRSAEAVRKLWCRAIERLSTELNPPPQP
jgi:RNA polymerase sigma-70 factor (ECF subfamily)